MYLRGTAAPGCPAEHPQLHSAPKMGIDTLAPKEQNAVVRVFRNRDLGSLSGVARVRFPGFGHPYGIAAKCRA
jgi:hypothetical protein